MCLRASINSPRFIQPDLDDDEPKDPSEAQFKKITFIMDSGKHIQKSNSINSASYDLSKCYQLTIKRGAMKKKFD